VTKSTTLVVWWRDHPATVAVDEHFGDKPVVARQRLQYGREIAVND
jgi:hypothetical protein